METALLLLLASILAITLSLLVVEYRRRSVQNKKIAALEEQNNASTIKLTLALERERQLTERIEEIKEQHREQSQTMDIQFKNMATEIFANQQQQLKNSNRESIQDLLKPFKENISSFKERVETIYNFENEQRGALRNELERLIELNRKITTETTNLTNALKSNSKVQGDWGEMVLETILDGSGLVKGTHYTVQSNFKDEKGNNLRPDVVLILPDNKQIVIDSKTSLTAFVNYANSQEAAQQKAHLEAHIQSVRNHVRELSAKEYHKLLNSPEFVVMFVPSEPAFLAALQADGDIWSDAYKRRVIISSPTNLFALLKLIGDLWRRDAQNKNTEEIARRGTKLYDQLVNFTSSLEGVGIALDNAKSKYDDAYKRFTTGNDNLIKTGERLRKLGISTTKTMSQKALEGNEE